MSTADYYDPIFMNIVNKNLLFKQNYNWTVFTVYDKYDGHEYYLLITFPELGLTFGNNTDCDDTFDSFEDAEEYATKKYGILHKRPD